MSPKTQALVAGNALRACADLRGHLEGAGFEVRVVHAAKDALEQLKKVPADLLVAFANDEFDGETLCEKAKQARPELACVLVYPSEEDDPEPYAEKAGADAFVFSPVRRAPVVRAAKTALRLRGLEAQVNRRDDKARDAAKGAQEKDELSPAREFELFKRVLLMEVKRSRRYKFPVSFLLVSLDRFHEKAAKLDAKARTEVLAEALSLITQAVRDIDLALPFQDERFLVFLPHTPEDGAHLVAKRMVEKLRKLKKLEGNTASIGVASFEPSGQGPAQVSFGSLLKEAADALRQAQSEGGNRAQVGEKKARERASGS